jgi:enoyl-CoA hydratase
VSDPPIVLERLTNGHLLLITINRPDRRNAFDGATSRAMEAAIDEYDADATLRCAIVTGAGGTFSAGADLIAAAAGDRPESPGRGLFGVFARPPRKPIIAAVEGFALAGGLELCLSCDLIVSSREALMGLPEAKRSLVAIGGALFRLPKRIPYHAAMELALTGRFVTAEEMHRLGLVNRLTEAGGALDAAIELASEIIAAGPLATIASKEIIRQSMSWSEADAWALQHAIAHPVEISEDFQEGLQSFAEKRDPVWKGR